MMKEIAHIGIAVKDINKSLKVFEQLLNLPIVREVDATSQGARAVFLRTGKEAEIELLEPSTPDGYIGKYIAKHGEGLHHICFEVTNIDEIVQSLQAQGVKTIQEHPVQNTHGGPYTKFIFFQPKDFNNVLIELVSKET